jgi:hypothetical protein
MSSTYEIPLTPVPQTLTTTFPNGVRYQLTLNYLFVPDDCWILDIADSSGNPLVQGIPLVTGCDLLEQYGYLGFGCAMICMTDGDPDEPPRFFNLGTTAHLRLVTS